MRKGTPRRSSRRRAVRRAAPRAAARARRRPRVGDGAQRCPGSISADEGVDRVARGDRRRRLQRADDLDARSGGSPISSWASRSAVKRRSPSVGVLPPARERDLARVAAQVVAAAGQDGVERAVAVEEQRDEDGRVRAADDVERPGPRPGRAGPPAGGRRRRRAPQCASETRSTRSLNIASLSSTRWTGHLAAMTCRRSTCSSVRPSGRRRTSWKRVGSRARPGCTRRRPRRRRRPSPCGRRTSPS